MTHKLNAEIAVCEGVARWEFTCAENEGSSCRRRCEGADGNGECHHLLTKCEWIDVECDIAELLNSDSVISAEGQHKDFIAWRGTVEAVWDGEWFDFEPVPAGPPQRNSVTDRLEEIAERLEKATPGPWKDFGPVDVGDRYEAYQYQMRATTDGHHILTSNMYPNKADADFIAHSREDMEFLLAQCQAPNSALKTGREASEDDQPPIPTRWGYNTERYKNDEKQRGLSDSTKSSRGARTER